MTNDFPQVLTIAGSDSDGSAGMQADLHTFFMHHTYGASVITACVAGNSFGIHDSVSMPVSFINQEFKDLADDFNILASKTGMLADAELIRTVVENYKKYDFGPLVVDPVIMTKHGAMLLEQAAYDTLKEELIPLATVLTPNFYEAQKLADMEINSDEDTKVAAKKLRELGAKNVIIKGKHVAGETDVVKDYVLLESGEDFWIEGPYYHTEHKNGTGDSLSAAITSEIAKGTSIADAIRIADDYVDKAIKNEISVAHKFGPINHWAQ
ncbi:bifunctional hydroxymethylpyrimidine kinase/phosphomethylpyrimidine kinase [Apilactobacillus kunkeei]|uniref:bifunctional hydroxymethylpyrimidine kinase/phosphomethylpyrimidine kinase n=1 Tax=Apilactobacillus TaxID=2767877 RepID=UPI00200AAB88|nr:bifunctional hydroxymethylpyrimidine kinase/phosphomethylpyrimidine kinase [Apilactobacillus kunkeei]MCK8619217.1 bifunctional hydroxymethylpyrimidine kinase/phosphomethylpyrimidine kinase [Apilactobacillus kunkeei]